MYFVQMLLFLEPTHRKKNYFPRGFWQDIISRCLGKEMFPPGLDIRCGTLRRVSAWLSCSQRGSEKQIPAKINLLASEGDAIHIVCGTPFDHGQVLSQRFKQENGVITFLREAVV